MPEVLWQSIDEPVRRGFAATVPITGTFTENPTAWDVQFAIKLNPEDAPLEIAPADIPAPTVTGSGPYVAVWTVPFTAAETAELSAGLNSWLFSRTDAGDETELAAGTWLVLEGMG